MQALQTLLQIALTPLANGHPRQAHPLGNRCIGLSSAAGQNDLSTLHDRMRQ